MVHFLIGGTAAWRAAGKPLEVGATHMFHPADDVWASPYASADRFAAFREYLDWEIALVAQLERDATTRFRTFAA